MQVFNISSLIHATQVDTPILNIDSSILSTVDSNGNKIPVSENQSIPLGTKIHLEVKWSVSDASKINPGDTSVIKLPSKYLLFYDSSVIDLKMPDGTLIGTFQIKDKQLLIIFNEAANKYAKLENGIIAITGITYQVKEPSDMIDGDIDIPNIDIPDDNPTLPEDPTVLPMPEADSITKNGYQPPNTNQINWSLGLNYDSLKSAMEKGEVTTKKNAVLVDRLSKGVSFSAIEIYHLLYPMTASNEVGLIHLDYGIRYYEFDEILQEENDTWESFFAKIEEAPGSYGVFKDAQGIETVMVGFGDLPGGVEGKLNLNGALEVLENASGKLTTAEKANSIEGLKKLDAATGNKMFLTPKITLKTTIANGMPTQEITNTAEFYYGNKKSSESESTVKYQSIEGSVEGVLPGQMKLIKQDDTGKTLENISFKLQKLSDDGTYVDYELKDGSTIKTTDSKGEILFDRLDIGTYKIVETSVMDEYGNPIYSISGKNTDIFEISRDDEQGILVSVVNPKKALVNIEGVKTWEDQDNQDGKRPEKVTINLLADGQLKASKEVSQADNWSYAFVNLPKYASGEEILYTITENEVPGYTTKIQGNNITNSYTPGKRSVTVTKSWEDNNNQDGLRPASIQVQLYGNDKAVGKAVSLSDGTSWSYTWEDLAEKANGQAIDYQVKEITKIAGYEVTVNDTDKGNILLTNTHVPKLNKPKEKNSLPKTGSSSKKGSLPKTGESLSLIPMVMGMLLLGVVYDIFKRMR